MEPAKILTVDDAASYQFLIRTTLARNGFLFFEAADGCAGIEIAKKFPSRTTSVKDKSYVYNHLATK